ncbi:hypothetical protein GCM10027176_76480 [Actinoallomurus bryophytorum]|uniref:Uncharacterized protein n=1 Tax=Actinoallomurus bryophytorum TaxID=1490222 RepID=A0A543C158_9ACTN|nr:hypothetical protein [Actinoallomurus bryophytorum]TQL90813.1 hypothetical protein FB559_8126 [Actinoallomurus bryophytorum]
MIKPDKVPLIQQETAVVVRPPHQDRGIELELARTTPSPATGRGAKKTRDPGRRRPPSAATLQNGS